MTDKTGTLPVVTGETEMDWSCLTCQFIVRSATLPPRCPRCGASRVKFVPVGAKGEADE